jgi:hypothetical protein
MNQTYMLILVFVKMNVFYSKTFKLNSWSEKYVLRPNAKTLERWASTIIKLKFEFN